MLTQLVIDEEWREWVIIANYLLLFSTAAGLFPRSDVYLYDEDTADTMKPT